MRPRVAGDRDPAALALGGALVLLGLLLRHGGLLLLAVPLFMFWGIGTFGRLSQADPDIRVRRELSARRVLAGERVRVTVTAECEGARPDHWVVFDVPPPGLEVVDGAAARAFDGRGGRTLQLQYELRATRGYHHWGEVRVAWADPFGGPSRERAVACESTLWALPRGEPLRGLGWSPRRTRVYSGFIKTRAGGAGLEFFDTRPYVPGDEVRRIHWKATARLGRWITTQYEQERVADVGIVLDTRRKSEVDCTHAGPAETHSLFERSVCAAAAVAQAALARGNRVGLLRYGRLLEWTSPGYGPRQRERVLHALAEAQLGDLAVFEDLAFLPRKLFPGRSQLVLISPLLHDDIPVLRRLRAHGYAVTVISPDPVRFERRWLASNTPVARAAAGLAELERGQRLRALRRVGVLVIDWNPFEPLQQALRERPWG